MFPMWNIKQIITFTNGLKSKSSTVPDGVVYTDVKKNLIIGNRGVLSCRFYGDPVAVYWVKGMVPENAPIQVVWHEGTKSGLKFDDGTYDMDDNYSLVIKEVQVTDTGRYICRVSNHRGILIHNYTDITLLHDALETEPEISLEKGLAGILPCKLNVRPKVVTWKKGPKYSSAKIVVAIDKYHNVGNISGTGYEEGLFNITTHYSLVIFNVNIEDEGRYFCELLEVDTDTTYKDFTNVSVFARPIKPFPAIEGCSTTEDHSNCILTVDSSVTLTCHANEYYPDIGLYFKHGSNEVAALYTETWNNTDGTKNQSVAIVGHKSHELYRCIAFGIPGVDGNRSTSVRLIGRNGSPNLVALIVPFLLIAIGLLTWIFLRRRGIVRGMSKGDRSTYQEDPVAYVELWKLVEYASKHKELHFLGDVIAIVCNDEKKSTRATTNEENIFYYNGLCRWKGTCTKRKQRTTLYNTLFQNGLRKSLANLRDFRGTVSTEICQLDLEHILREIGEQDKITKFLGNLKIDPPERPGEAETSLTAFHQQALGKLITWTRGKRDINPVIILSSTLEKLKHESANNFFVIPDEQKQGLSDSEYKGYARYFARYHVTMLAAIIESSTNTPVSVINCIVENLETLFNIEKMLRDWWEALECSNYKKRCTLGPLPQGQQKPLEDTKHTADEQWPSDDELKLIANYLDQKSTKHVSERLGITDLSESADEQKRFEALHAWRQSNKGEWTELHSQLLAALKDTNISGLLPPLRNDALHKVEVVAIAFNLLMTDILLVARHLGVCEAKLSSYRPVFEPSHLTKGTIGLVSTLLSLLDKSKRKEDLWMKLRDGGFPSTIQRKMIAYEMSYGELSTISDAVMRSGTRSEENANTAQEGSQPNEGDPLLGTEDMLSQGTTIVPIELDVGEAQESGQRFSIIKKMPKLTDEEEAAGSLATDPLDEFTIVREAQESGQRFSMIKKMLKLTDEEVAAGSLATDTQDEFTLFKIWKEKLRLSAFNYRAAVIKCLHDFGKSDIARTVIEGKYKADDNSLAFIKHMVKKVISDNRLERLAEVLNLQMDLPGTQRSDDAISEIICARLMVLKHASGLCNQREKGRDTRRSINHDLQVCEFDKLVDHGFLDLVRELLIIDQQ